MSKEKEKDMKFRTESFCGSGERDAVEVIRHETFVMGNTDIFEYIEYIAKNILPGTAMARLLRKYSDGICDETFTDNLSLEGQRLFIQKVLKEVSDKTGINCRYAIWLASKEGAWQYWLDSQEQPGTYHVGKPVVPDDFLAKSDIDVYDESKGVVLSDLQSDGALYAFEKIPVPFCTAKSAKERVFA